MAEVKCVATRESYGNALKELAQNGADNLVVLDADLSAATKTAIFKNAFPDRHINCGIAESNMMSVAAGLSTMGYVPFASSFAMFAAGRAFEQIRNSVGYPHLNVKSAPHMPAFRRRGRRFPPVLRGFCAYAFNSRNGCYLPGRRC